MKKEEKAMEEITELTKEEYTQGRLSGFGRITMLRLETPYLDRLHKAPVADSTPDCRCSCEIKVGLNVYKAR